MRRLKTWLLMGLVLLVEAPTLHAEKSGGWKVLEHCTFIPNDSANDGDSFWIQHKRKKLKIRLYFVDSPETTDEEEWALARLKEQAEYFNSDEKAMLRTGSQAKKFTQKLLSEQPDGFTVYTRLEEAMGRGKQRYYAMVDVNGRFLSELLAENGLVRLNKRTMVAGPLPNEMSVDKYEQHLRRLEQQARRESLGGWGAQGRKERSVVARVLKERGEGGSDAAAAPSVPEGVVELTRHVPVYSLLVPGKLVRLLKPKTKIKVLGASEDGGMAVIRFNTEPGIIHEAQCQIRDL